MAELVEPTHIGDGFYMIDNGYEIAIAVNHHTNIVVYIHVSYYDRVIEYINKCKENNKK